MITRLKLSTVEQGLPKYRSMLAGNTAFVPAFESIATTTVGSTSVASVTFSSIPSTYTHLQIRCLMKKAGTGNDSFSFIHFNGDTNTNYSTHYLLGTGTGVISGANSPSVADIFGGVTWGTGSSVSSSTFSAAVIDILDYTNTNKYTTVRTLSGVDGNGAGQMDFTSGMWMNTNAVTSIEIAGNGGNFNQYSHFALYGIKVA